MSVSPAFSAHEVAAIHDRTTALWHREPATAFEPHPDLLAIITAQHRANFDLWHCEDRARAPHATDREIVEIKHAIDRFNQLRNDLAERADMLLLHTLHPLRLPNPAAELHSESPGLMIDRLSILALKIYHTREELDRPEAPSGHRERNTERLAQLSEQRADLILCLDQLWQQVLSGNRRFKIYRQLKMYNDPALNPAIYGSS